MQINTVLFENFAQIQACLGYSALQPNVGLLPQASVEQIPIHCGCSNNHIPSPFWHSCTYVLGINDSCGIFKKVLYLQLYYASAEFLEILQTGF